MTNIELLQKAKEDHQKALQYDALMESINKIGYKVNQIGDGVFELIKDETSAPVGDYLNPIPFESGMTITTGLWYTDGSDIWDASIDGVAEEFTAPWFNVIEV